MLSSESELFAGDMSKDSHSPGCVEHESFYNLGPSLLSESQESESESESELFTGDTSKDNHSPGPVFREVSP